MSVQDAYTGFAPESTYGTYVEPTRSFRGEQDQLKAAIQELMVQGMYDGKHGQPSDLVKTIARGAAGDYPLTVLTKGMGMLFKAMMGTSANALAGGAASAFLQQHDSDPDGPEGEFLSYQIIRPTVPTGEQVFSYKGVKIPSWQLSQSLDDMLKLTLTLDAREEVTNESAHTFTEPSGIEPYTWDELAVTIGGASVKVLEFNLSGDNSLKTERYYMQGSALKDEPLRIASPTYEGSIRLDFEDLTQYNRFKAGTFHEIVATWTNPTEIESGFNPFVKVTLPACKFTGETPEVDAEDGDLPRQPLPFTVYWDLTNPMVSLDYQTADTSY